NDYQHQANATTKVYQPDAGVCAPEVVGDPECVDPITGKWTVDWTVKRPNGLSSSTNWRVFEGSYSGTNYSFDPDYSPGWSTSSTKSRTETYSGNGPAVEKVRAEWSGNKSPEG